MQHKKQVFGDIQSMINQYKQTRSGSKNHDENRPRQLGADQSIATGKVDLSKQLPPRYSPTADQRGAQSAHQTEPSVYSEARSGNRPPPSMHYAPPQATTGLLQGRHDSQTRRDSSREGSLKKKAGFTTFGTVTPSRDYLGEQPEYTKN